MGRQVRCSRGGPCGEARRGPAHLLEDLFALGVVAGLLASAGSLAPPPCTGEQARTGQGQHWKPAPQPLQQPAGHLLRTLLFTHESVQHQRCAGQSGDHPLQHRQLPLRPGKVVASRKLVSQHQRRRCAYATCSSVPVVGLGLVVSSAMEASLRSRRLTHHSSCCSINRLPASRNRAASLGNTPTTSVRRPISRLTPPGGWCCAAWRDGPPGSRSRPAGRARPPPAAGPPWAPLVPGASRSRPAAAGPPGGRRPRRSAGWPRRPAAAGPWAVAQGVVEEVDRAALPRGAQHLGDRGLETSWASETTSCTPARPRPTRPRRNSRQNASVSAGPTSRPMTSRWPD
jgi:hypothetical protein